MKVPFTTIKQGKAGDDDQVFRLTDIDTRFVSLVTAGANRQKKFQLIKSADGHSVQSDWSKRAEKFGIELLDEGENVTKFSGSPRNRFGTHSSYQFKGNYEAAWVCYMSQWGGGQPGADATASLRGTVRRTEMIAATKDPPCSLPTTDDIDARGGDSSPLTCSFAETPGDYDLDKFDTPETEEEKEGVKLTCSDLAIIKRTALAEIKRRNEDAEKGAHKQAGGSEVDVRDDLDEDPLRKASSDLYNSLRPGEPTVEELYGDPVNLRYSMGTEENEWCEKKIAAAYALFRETADDYQPESRAKVYERIVRAAIAEGLALGFDPEDVLDAGLPAEVQQQMKDGTSDEPEGSDGSSAQKEEGVDLTSWLNTAGATVEGLWTDALLAKALDGSAETPPVEGGHADTRTGEVGERDRSPSKEKEETDRKELEEANQKLQEKVVALEAEIKDLKGKLAKQNRALTAEKAKAVRLSKSAIGGSTSLLTGEVTPSPEQEETKKDSTSKAWRSGGDMAAAVEKGDG